VIEMRATPFADIASVRKADLLAALPPEWPEDPFPEIQRHVRAAGRKIAVLDSEHPTQRNAL